MNGSTSRELCSQRENELCAREFERDNMEKPWWEGSSGRDHPRGIGREGLSKTSRHWEQLHQRQRAKRLLWGERVLFIGTQFSILYTSMYSQAETVTPRA